MVEILALLRLDLLSQRATAGEATPSHRRDYPKYHKFLLSLLPAEVGDTYILTQAEYATKKTNACPFNPWALLSVSVPSTLGSGSESVSDVTKALETNYVINSLGHFSRVGTAEIRQKLNLKGPPHSTSSWAPDTPKP